MFLKSKKFWIKFCILLSYIISYGVPVFVAYLIARNSFIRTYVISAEVSLSFIGFVVFASFFAMFLLLKITIKLIKSKASIGKTVFFMIMVLSIVALFIVLTIKAYNITYLIEADIITFFIRVRELLTKIKNALIGYGACLLVSNILKIIAIALDKEYVRELGWI